MAGPSNRWTCTKCGASNHVLRDRCYGCSEASPSAGRAKRVVVEPLPGWWRSPRKVASVVAVLAVVVLGAVLVAQRGGDTDVTSSKDPHGDGSRGPARAVEDTTTTTAATTTFPHVPFTPADLLQIEYRTEQETDNGAKFSPIVRVGAPKRLDDVNPSLTRNARCPIQDTATTGVVSISVIAGNPGPTSPQLPRTVNLRVLGGAPQATLAGPNGCVSADLGISWRVASDQGAFIRAELAVPGMFAEGSPTSPLDQLYNIGLGVGIEPDSLRDYGATRVSIRPVAITISSVKTGAQVARQDLPNEPPSEQLNLGAAKGLIESTH